MPSPLPKGHRLHLEQRESGRCPRPKRASSLSGTLAEEKPTTARTIFSSRAENRFGDAETMTHRTSL